MKRKKIIVFFGIDGTGKTTLVEEIKKRLGNDKKESEIVYMGLAKKQKLPFLKSAMKIYFKIRWSGKNEKTTYTKEKDWHRDRKFVWLVVYFFELWAKYLSIIRKSKSEYILCDRYFFDGLVYSREKSFNFFRRFIPKPDMCFLICVPEKIIIKRKEEADEKAIRAFYKKADIISKHFKIKKIDNTQKLNQVVDIIYKEIKNLDNNENKFKRVSKR